MISQMFLVIEQERSHHRLTVYHHSLPFPFRCVGDYRGDKQKFFKANCVRLLTRDEVAYISNLVSQYLLVILNTLWL